MGGNVTSPVRFLFFSIWYQTASYVAVASSDGSVVGLIWFRLSQHFLCRTMLLDEDPFAEIR